jgi:hypothetical protein
MLPLCLVELAFDRAAARIGVEPELPALVSGFTPN